MAQRRSRKRRVLRRLLLTILLAVTAVVVGGGVDYALLNSRIHRVHVTFPPGGKGDTWLVVGSDSRNDIPSGENVNQFGSATDVPGQRADVLLVIHIDGGHCTTTSIPRDTLVSPADGQISRVALTLLHGAQALVDGMYRSLHIAVNHLVIFTMKAFVGVVDALGGIDVTEPTAVRDKWTGLFLPAGTTHIDGEQALALVRSRHPELYDGTRWNAVDEKTGASYRARWAQTVFEVVVAKLHDEMTNPLVMQRAGWRVSGGVTVDAGTSLLDFKKWTAKGRVDVSSRDRAEAFAVHDEPLRSSSWRGGRFAVKAGGGR